MREFNLHETYERIISELNRTIYLILTFGTGIGALITPVTNCISGSYPTFGTTSIILLIVCIITLSTNAIYSNKGRSLRWYITHVLVELIDMLYYTLMLLPVTMLFDNDLIVVVTGTQAVESFLTGMLLIVVKNLLGRFLNI